MVYYTDPVPITFLVWVVACALAACPVLALLAWLLWRRNGPEERALLKRIMKLPIRRKLRLALALSRDERVPLRLRALPPALVVYLASPLDLIPDFIPVIGLIDDVLVALVGVGLLLRFAPRAVLEELVERMESLADARPPRS
jgi:uncharacterized membrane protein YkvA (DUF1232 family)